MDWLNIHIPSVIRSPEFIGAEPVDRSTHIMLLAFCAGLENGGIIRDCAGWKDRKWQQLAAVTHAETRRECELWHWVGNDLHVHHYPSEKETLVRTKRAIAQTNGAKSGGRPRNPQKTNVGFSEKPTSVNSPKAEGEEEGEKEGEAEAAAAAAPDAVSLAEKLIEAHPRPSKNRAALEAAFAALRLDPFPVILAGVKAYATVVDGWPPDEQVAYTMTAAKFFEKMHWRDDPKDWQSRRASKLALNGTRPTVDIGGRKPAGILDIRTARRPDDSELAPEPTFDLLPTK